MKLWVRQCLWHYSFMSSLCLFPSASDQLAAFSDLKFNDGNPMVDTFRPVQPLNNRLVYRSTSNMVLASGMLLTVSISAAIGLSWPN